MVNLIICCDIGLYSCRIC